MTKRTQQWVVTVIVAIVFVSGIWFASSYRTVVASAKQDPGCERAGCMSVDVRREGLRIQSLAQASGCSYEANLYMNGSRLSSNVFRFGSGCPGKITLSWPSANHCTINFDGDTARVIFSWNNVEWKYGTP
jgi:hypothetical protein